MKKNALSVYSLVFGLFTSIIVWMIYQTIDAKGIFSDISFQQFASVMMVMPFVLIILPLAAVIFGILGLIKGIKEKLTPSIVMSILGIILAIFPFILGLFIGAAWLEMVF